MSDPSEYCLARKVIFSSQAGFRGAESAAHAGSGRTGCGSRV